MERFKEILRNIGVLGEVKPVKPKEPPLDPGPCKVFPRLEGNYYTGHDVVVIEQDGIEKRVIYPFTSGKIKSLEVFNEGHTFVAIQKWAGRLAIFHKDKLYHPYIFMAKVSEGFKMSPNRDYLLFKAVEGQIHAGRWVGSEGVVHILRLEDMQMYPISECVDTGREEWWPCKFDFSEDGKEVKIDFSGPVETTEKNIPIKEEYFDKWNWYYEERSYNSGTSDGGGFMGTGQRFPSYFYRRD